MVPKGALITALVAGLSMAGVVGAFVSGASPYVTIAQARTAGGDRLQLYGEVSHRTRDFATGRTSFTLKDKTGATVTVENLNPPPPSFDEASHAVAIGAMRGDRFVAQELLVKCPSKYGDKPRSPLGRAS